MSGCQAGSSGGGDGQFNFPEGAGFDNSGNVYVADNANHRIQKFDPDGTLLRMWGWGVLDGSPEFQICTSGCQAGQYGVGDGQFTNPADVAVDAAGNVYVADTNNHRIQKFDSDSSFLFMWGNYCDAGTSAPGVCDGKFNSPSGVAVDGAGKVYVADRLNDRIEKFDSSGTFLSKWGSTGSGESQFDLPFRLAADASGKVYVAEFGNNRIQKFDSNGSFLGEWGSVGTGEAQFSGPQGVAVDASGNVYVGDTGNQRIQIFGGPWLEFFIAEAELPSGH